MSQLNQLALNGMNIAARVDWQGIEVLNPKQFKQWFAHIIAKLTCHRGDVVPKVGSDRFYCLHCFVFRDVKEEDCKFPPVDHHHIGLGPIEGPKTVCLKCGRVALRPKVVANCSICQEVILYLKHTAESVYRQGRFPDSEP